MTDVKDLYREATTAEEDFTLPELKKLRFLLRRLRYLETQIQKREAAKQVQGEGGALSFVEAERDALEFALLEIGYLDFVDRSGGA